MEKHCEFCARPIEDYRRSTKRYCSDTCKQLSFYARQGKDWGKNLKAHNLLLCGKEMELPAEEQQARITGLPQEPAASLFNVKPPEDSIKNEAGSGFSVKSPDFDTPNGGAQDERTVKRSPETPVIVKQDAQSDDSGVKKPAGDPLTVKLPEPAPRYEWISSPLLEMVEQYRQQYNCEEKFLNSELYWHGENIEAVAWVTTRLHCLLVNTLRLSSYSYVDRQTLRTLARAFKDMVKSYTFRVLPYNYPFKRFAEELRYKFDEIAGELEGDEVKLRLSQRSKAEMLCVRFIIGNSVNHKSFHHLRFTDDVSEDLQRQVDEILDAKYGKVQDQQEEEEVKDPE